MQDKFTGLINTPRPTTRPYKTGLPPDLEVKQAKGLINTFSRTKWSWWMAMRAGSGNVPHIGWHSVKAFSNASL
jgi:hypothetical protein